MTATRQDKAEWMATRLLWDAKRSTETAFGQMTSAAINFDRCGQPERGRECLKIAGILGGQSIAINDLYRQLTEEEQ